MIRVSIVEDDAGLASAIAMLLETAGDFRCHSVHATAEDALRELPKSPPDIVLMDINLPGMSGIDCVAELAAQLPAVRIVMLTAFENSADIFASLSAGAYGYLLKSTEPTQLLESIREVAAGGSPISGSVARRIVEWFRGRLKVTNQVESLSPRELEVLKLLSTGCPYKQIADEMGVTLGTVRSYIQRIYEKLHVHSRTEAVAKYLGRQ